MGCVAEACNKGSITFTPEVNSNTNKLSEENINYGFMQEPQYDQMSKEFFNVLNDIRTNPENFLEESKEHNLFEIFIKLKPCSDIIYKDNDLDPLKKYIMNSYFKNKNLIERDNEIKKLINENLSEICLFQTISTNNNIKQNVWDFLEENEDDIEKIFDTLYNKLIIISIPLEHNTKILLTLIFYKE